MKLKRKLLLTTSILMVAVTPIATVISCGKNNINFGINDGINGQNKLIDIKSDDLRILGINGQPPKDGESTFQLSASPNKTELLKKAGATYEYFVKYYWKGVSAKFEPIPLDASKNPDIKNLRVEDEIQVKITFTKQGFEIHNKGVFTKQISNEINDGIPINWSEPAISTISKVDSMISVQGDTLKIKLTNPVKLNELVFAIAKKLKYLFSNDSSRYIALQADLPTNPITLKDIWSSLDQASKTGIKKLEITNQNTNKTDTLDLEDMKNIIMPDSKINLNMSALVNEGKTLLEKYKNSGIDDKKRAKAGIFTANPIATKFASVYGSVVANPETTPRLLVLIGAMENDPTALNFIPKLAVAYGNIFQWIIKSEAFINWTKSNKFLRDVEIDNVPNIFMSTLFRVNPNS